MKLPRNIGPIHFVGIGGIGMSGIAEVLVNLGYTVIGSDVAENANVKRLRDKGVKIAIGHKAENIDGADVVVVSSAIKQDNPELVAARAKRLPVVRRAEMLAELMRLKSCVAIAGTHGKTTTTSLVAALLDAGGLDPTVINGGIINAYGTNARLGAGDWMVVEADESDGTFLKLPADIAIVTNVDAEHLDHFKTFAAVQEAFIDFVGNVPFYGFAVMCTDHPIVQRLVGRIDRPPHHHLRRKSAGRRAARPISITTTAARNFPCCSATARASTVHAIKDLVLPMPGRHNALNATSAVAVAHELKIPDDTIRAALAKFGGVKRRFTKVGEWNGATIIDDYGHHPVEIAAVLKAARDVTKGQVIAVVQPHRYTRLQDLVRAVLDLLQRRRRRDRRRRLSGGRSADRRRRPRSSGAGAARARPPPGDPARGPARNSPASSRSWPSPAITWSASAPARSRNWAYALPEQLKASSNG